ncbi:MAG: DUF1461 domain-containing protein [Atopobiaceae bacterium]
MDTQRTSDRTGPGRVAATALAAVLLVCSILGISFSLLLTPGPTALATSLFSDERGTGLTHEECARVGQNVLAFSMGYDDADLPWGTGETPTTLGEQSRAHLISVRSLFLGTIRFAVVSSVALAAMLAVCARRFGRRCAGTALIVGGACSIGIAALFAMLASVDFYTLFNWLHGWFFSSGSWLFPADALLIKSLPEPLWMFLGALFGVLIAALSTACVVGGRRLRRARLEDELLPA